MPVDGDGKVGKVTGCPHVQVFASPQSVTYIAAPPRNGKETEICSWALVGWR